MLSLTNLSNAGGLTAYYTNVESSYYSSNDGSTAWFGLGAAQLGLSGGVDVKDFSQIINGQFHGVNLRQKVGKERVGMDATFSAPKSVSLDVLLRKNGYAFVAHRYAVDKCLEHCERLAEIRLTRKGKTSKVGAGGLVIAKFEHDLSRNNDPQLHTHCVIANTAFLSAGKWRALDSLGIYQNKMLLGAIYRSELARQLQMAGLQVEIQHADGRFELAGYSSDLIEKFSTRSADIEKELNELGHTRASAHAVITKIATLNTRAAKKDLDRDALFKSWTDRIGEAGLPHLQQSSFDTTERNADSIRKLIQQTIEQLSERHSSFHQIEFLTRLTQMSVGSHIYSEIVAGYQTAIEDGLLVKNSDFLTTPELMALEQSVVDLEHELRGKNAATQLQNPTIFQELTKALNDGQKLAVKAILESTDSVLAVQGRAGVGKTTLLKAAKHLLEITKHDVVALAPTTAATRELTNSGFSGSTVSSFLLRGRNSVNSKTVIFLDEAGLLSTNQVNEIFRTVKETGCKLVMIGDEAQLSSVEAGRPFAYLQKAGMATIQVAEIQRQKNKALKKAVELSIEGRGRLAVQLLSKDIHEIASPSDRYSGVARAFSKLSPEQRVSTLVVAGTRVARDCINLEIREQLGVSDEAMLTCLSRKDLTNGQRKSILHYEAGDVLKAQVAFKTLGVQRGELISVLARDRGCLLVTTEEGREISLDPVTTHRFEVFRPKSMAVGKGDLLRFGENIHSLDVANGDRATVIECRSQQEEMVVQLESGRKLVLDVSKPLALDYGYCSTVYSSQGKTCREVLIEADAHSATSNQQAFYVAISRAQERAQIFTDDREHLPDAMSRDLNRPHALEIDGAHEMEVGR